MNKIENSATGCSIDLDCFKQNSVARRLKKIVGLVTSATVLTVMATSSSLQASIENPTDYSTYGSYYSGASSTYLSDVYPAQTDQSGAAEFSWDTVPRCIFFRSGSRMSDAGVTRVANHYSVVMLEKSNEQGLTYTEDGVIDVATRLKAENADIKNLYYWNSFYRWGGYEANIEFDLNDVIWSRTAGVYDSSGRLRYTHNNTDFQDWWIDNGVDVAMNSAIDGVFLDTLDNWEGRYYNDDGSTVTEYSSYWKYGHTDMVNQLVNQLPASKLIIGNGATYNHEPNGGREWLRVLDGTYTEGWQTPNSTSTPAQTQADGTAISMQLLREAAVKGKTVLFRSNPENNTQFTGEAALSYWTDTLADRLDYVERNVYYPLAVFLMIADENSFFHFSDGVYAGVGENDWHIWDTSYMDIFANPLGDPLGGPVSNGYLYTRSFLYLDVSVNVDTGATSFDWKDNATEVVNLALGASTTQSSDAYGGVSSRAVDGDTNGVFSGGSVTHTANEANAWWEVDLGENRMIRAIKIFNRTDCCMGRLSNVVVSVIHSDGTTVYTDTLVDYPDSTVVLDADDVVGSRVRIELAGTNPLSLAEVEVYGSPNPIVSLRKRNALSFAMDGNWGGGNGQDVYLYDYTATNVNQQWEEIDQGNGYHSYQKVGTDYSLDAGDGGAQNQNVTLWSSDATDPNQQWLKVDMGNGFYQLRKSDAQNFAIDGGSGGLNGRSLELWDSSNASYNLQWSIE